MTQISQGLSYKLCSTISSNILAFGLFTLAFEIPAIIHLQLVAMLRRYMKFFHAPTRDVLHHYIFFIAQLWLTFHPRNTVVLLDTGTPGTCREIYGEDADCETRTRDPSVINRVLLPLS